MTYASIKYWVEGTKEAIHKLKDAIDAADGWARNALENLGLDPEQYDTHRVEWNNAAVEDKEDYSVLSFDEDFPYERGDIIDQLMETDLFKGKLTALYYFAEEMANSELCETNDSEGKYWPNRLSVSIEDEDGEQDWFYCRDEQELAAIAHERYGVPAELNDVAAIKQFVDNRSEEDEAMWVTPIEVVAGDEKDGLRVSDIRQMIEDDKIKITLKSKDDE